MTKSPWGPSVSPRQSTLVRGSPPRPVGSPRRRHTAGTQKPTRRALSSQTIWTPRRPTPDTLAPRFHTLTAMAPCPGLHTPPTPGVPPSAAFARVQEATSSQEDSTECHTMFPPERRRRNHNLTQVSLRLIVTQSSGHLKSAGCSGRAKHPRRRRIPAKQGTGLPPPSSLPGETHCVEPAHPGTAGSNPPAPRTRHRS